MHSGAPGRETADAVSGERQRMRRLARERARHGEAEVLLDLYLPVGSSVIAGVTEAVREEFPEAVIGDSGRPEVLRLLTAPTKPSETTS